MHFAAFGVDLTKRLLMDGDQGFLTLQIDPAEHLVRLLKERLGRVELDAPVIALRLEARDVRMGQYGHSNQPSHHIIWMYDEAGQPCIRSKGIGAGPCPGTCR